jgi:CheY-like chemotaxis protein
VRILLPRQAGTSDDDVVQLGSVSALRAEGDGTVLVVDDEASVRALVAEVLEGLGYKVIEAADGPSGLTVLRSDVRIDLLVSDVGMPGGMNGRQMVDAARQRRPTLRVLFITGYAERAVFGDGEMPADMYLMVKPFTMQALASRIKELIG